MKVNKYIIIIVVLLIILFTLDHVQSQQEKEKVLVVATIDTAQASKPEIKQPEIQAIQSDPIMEELPKPKEQPAKNPVVTKKKEPVKVEKPTSAPINPQKIYKKSFWMNWKHMFTKDDPIQDVINYAYKKGGKDFLLTLEGENGLWKWDRKSGIVGSNGYSDYGLCQLNAQYHGKFIFANGYNLKDGFSNQFKDPYKQVDICFEVWQDAFEKGRIKTTFYAYNNRHNKAGRFENLK